MPLVYSFVSTDVWIVSPFLVFVDPIRLTIVSILTSGFPRQFWLIYENIRCSILFHLLVPGGKWHTEISKFISTAKRCNSLFHSLTRDPLLPPPSAVISNFVVRIINAVRRCSPLIGIGKVMCVNFLRTAFWSPSAAFIRKFTYNLFLFGVN